MGFGQVWGWSNKTAERHKWSSVFSSVFPPAEVSDLQQCSKENGKIKLEQIGRAPVFPRTICDRRFSKTSDQFMQIQKTKRKQEMCGSDSRAQSLRAGNMMYEPI